MAGAVRLRPSDLMLVALLLGSVTGLLQMDHRRDAEDDPEPNKAILEMLHINKVSANHQAKAHPYMRRVFQHLDSLEDRDFARSDGTLVQSFRSVVGMEVKRNGRNYDAVHSALCDWSCGFNFVLLCIHFGQFGQWTRFLHLPVVRYRTGHLDMYYDALACQLSFYCYYPVRLVKVGAGCCTVGRFVVVTMTTQARVHELARDRGPGQLYHASVNTQGPDQGPPGWIWFNVSSLKPSMLGGELVLFRKTLHPRPLSVTVTLHSVAASQQRPLQESPALEERQLTLDQRPPSGYDVFDVSAVLAVKPVEVLGFQLRYTDETGSLVLHEALTQSLYCLNRGSVGEPLLVLYQAHPLGNH